jgi:hypothetical protein
MNASGTAAMHPYASMAVLLHSEKVSNFMSSWDFIFDEIRVCIYVQYIY